MYPWGTLIDVPASSSLMEISCNPAAWRQMIAIIGDTGNAASIALHRRHGFALVGTLHAVGFKLGRWVDTVLMQRALGPGAAAPPGDDRGNDGPDAR